MKKTVLIHTVLALCIGLGAGSAFAAEQEVIYGSQLMTEQERIEHRTQMRNMKTNEEREAFRLEHHNRMQIRAQEQGVTLPDEPLPRGRGMGPKDGMGPGAGQGPRGGMGPGGGRGQ